MTIRPLGVLLVLVLAGCASGGNEVLKNQDAAAVNTLIVDKKTTRDEVLRIYGSPTQSSFLNEKNEIFTYRWARATAQGQNFIPIVGAFARAYDVHKKQLVIIFNEQNVVARHTMTDVNDSVKSGLADGGAPKARTDATTMSSIDSNVTGAEAAVVATGDKQEANEVPAGSSKPGTEIPAASSKPAAVARPAQVRAAGSLPSAGIWECGMRNGRRTFKLQFVVGANNSIIVTSYANAPATVVQKDPLTMTAMNPRGDRPMNIVWNLDNTMDVTGPNTSGGTFHDSGACTRV